MMIEELEPRRLLSFTHIVKDNGTLLVVGTSRADEIQVNMSATPTPVVSITDETRTVFISSPPDTLPSRIVIKGAGGADRISISESFKQMPVTVRGGAGDDHISISSGNGIPASIWGDDGNDRIELGGGGIGDGFYYAIWQRPLTVRGGAGDDVIKLNAYLPEGNDSPLASAHLLGGQGNDHIMAGGGADRLFGGAGNDTILGRDGNDLIVGGPGNDRLLGGHGRDRIRPGW